MLQAVERQLMHEWCHPRRNPQVDLQNHAGTRSGTNSAVRTGADEPLQCCTVSQANVWPQSSCAGMASTLHMQCVMQSQAKGSILGPSATRHDNLGNAKQVPRNRNK